LLKFFKKVTPPIALLVVKLFLPPNETLSLKIPSPITPQTLIAPEERGKDKLKDRS
jgi:hypothetical protein